MKKILLVLLIFSGCATNPKATNYECADDGTTCSIKPVATVTAENTDFDQPCAKKDNKCIQQKMQHFESLCRSADGEACYKRGLAQEEYDESFQPFGDPYLIQWYSRSCKAGDIRGCSAEKSTLLKDCVRVRTWFKADPGCYTQGADTSEVQGISSTTEIRINSEECISKLKDAELGCPLLGDYEAKNGNKQGAEKIYTDGCVSKSKNATCGRLVGVAHEKQKSGQSKEARKLLKTACDFSETAPGQYE
jgi:hypothetical protein